MVKPIIKKLISLFDISMSRFDTQGFSSHMIVNKDGQHKR